MEKEQLGQALRVLSKKGGFVKDGNITVTNIGDDKYSVTEYDKPLGICSFEVMLDFIDPDRVTHRLSEILLETTEKRLKELEAAKEVEDLDKTPLLSELEEDLDKTPLLADLEDLDKTPLLADLEDPREL